MPESDSNCVFCKIVAGEIPSHRVYEDEDVFAFLDIGPLAEGHTLVIPKDHSQTIDRMSDDSAAACARALVRVSRAVAEATGVAGWNVLQNNGKVSGQEVGHVHFHVIPRRDGDELGYRWLARSLDSEAAAATAEAIRKRLDE